MQTPFTAPKFDLKAFNCPNCGAYSDQIWRFLYATSEYPTNLGFEYLAVVCYEHNLVGMKSAFCRHCQELSYWFAPDKMVFPFGGNAALPNSDMPEDVKLDYLEARNIMNLSPRGAAALLRLAIQKLCKHLGGSGENINNDISILVKAGLPVKLQQALDSVRVIGNHAVHPGQIDLTDNVDTVHKLFAFINIICDNQITQPKQIDEFYQQNVPDNLKEAISKRDMKS